MGGYDNALDEEHFYPRPPRGGRHSQAQSQVVCLQNFYPRPPRGGRPIASVEVGVPIQISIHALREEGDSPFWPSLSWWVAFLSTPSARRATSDALEAISSNPTISIHALREEGDPAAFYFIFSQPKFLSTPSARRATPRYSPGGWSAEYFYPRPPRGGRHRPSGEYTRRGTYFYPRPPRGGRPAGAMQMTAVNEFLSTPSARRATRLYRPRSTTVSNFYPRPPRGGRPFTSSMVVFHA